MAVNRHLGFYRSTNSAVRSADPENPSLEANMEWIGCTVCEIFAFKVYTVMLKMGFVVTQGHRKRHHWIEHIQLYIRLSIVTMPLSLYKHFQDIASHWSKIATPLYLAPPLGVMPSELRNDPRWRKTRMMVLADREKGCDRQTDGQTDEQPELASHIPHSA